MSGVDNRIVTMQFNNKDFETNARTSLSTLAKLKEQMNFGSVVGSSIRGLGTISSALSKLGLKTPFGPMISMANKGLSGVGLVLDKLGLKNPFAAGTTGATDLARAADGTTSHMQMLEGGVTAVSNKFVALATIAVTALSNITNKAVNAGLAFAKSFTVGPIIDGLHEYETNLKSIQTVQANTDRPLPEVNAALQELNKYSDQTIYNFSEMARNVGTFTAAGVDLKTSVSSIKGIANMAALSGSSSEQAATAMYQLSQAIASGKVGLMDWNSVVNAGMGGKKLQGALAQTAIAMGKIDKAQVKGTESGKQLTIMGKSFRESIMASPGSSSWLTSGVLTNALASLDGRYSAAALSQEKLANGTLKYKNAAQVANAIDKARAQAAKDGVKYTDAQFKALQHLSTQAYHSATQVKTLGQVFDVAKESIGSGWGSTFQNIFGNLTEAKKTFTGMSNYLNNLINQNSLARNNMLAAWKKGGGRNELIDGLKNAWGGLVDILTPIHEAFRDIFPATTAKSLLALTHSFFKFTESLTISEKTAGLLYRTFSGVFAFFHILVQIIGAVAHGVGVLFGAVSSNSGSFLGFTAGIGDMVVAFDKFLKKSGILTTFFGSLGGLLSLPVQLLSGIASAIGAIFSGFNLSAGNKVVDTTGKMATKMNSLSSAAAYAHDWLLNLGDSLSHLGETIGKALGGIGPMIAKFLTSDSFGPALHAINTGLFAALTASILHFLKGPKVDISGGLFSQISNTLKGVTGSLTAMQNNLNAGTLIKLGGAIAVLAGALYLLSTINPSSMAKALTAMGAGFAVLIVVMKVLSSMAGPVTTAKIFVLSVAMIALAGAMLLLAAALKVMAGINFGDTARGLLALKIMLDVISKSMVTMSASSKGMFRTAASLLVLAVAINLLAVALKIFATMSWGEMIKGLAGLTGVLVALSVGLRGMPPIGNEAVTLVALGLAINMLAIALKVFGTMSWAEMAKGLIMLTGSLAGIAVAMKLMPKGMLLQAVALVAVAGAMVILSGALKVMGGMGWEQIAKGLIVLGGAMLIIAVGLQAIGVVGTIGAVGLLLTAAALAIMLPVLVAFASMSWGGIAKGLVMLVGLFTILGVAATLAGLQIVVLGAGMLLLGAGLALAGAGILAMATALGIVVGLGTAAGAALVMLLGAVVKAIPGIFKAVGEGIIQMAKVIGQGAPRIAHAFGQILSNFLDQVQKNVPKLAKTFTTMITAALNVIQHLSPKITQTGIKLIVDFLRAIDAHISEMTRLAGDIIVKFINGVSRQLPRIVDAGVRLIINFINGLSHAIDAHSKEMGEAGGRLGVAIVRGMASGLSGAAGVIKDAAIQAAKNALDAAKHFLGVGSPSKVFRDEVGHWLPVGMALGIDDTADAPVRSIDLMGRSAVSQMKRTMAGVEEAFALDPNFNPTISPVLDLTALSQEANKIGGILSAQPVIPTVSYATAADISATQQASADAAQAAADAAGDPGAGDTNLTLELHSPRPIDSVEAYRAGKTLISLAKEALDK